jgi:hypothetical protein
MMSLFTVTDCDRECRKLLAHSDVNVRLQGVRLFSERACLARDELIRIAGRMLRGRVGEAESLVDQSICDMVLRLSGEVREGNSCFLDRREESVLQPMAF